MKNGGKNINVYNFVQYIKYNRTVIVDAISDNKIKLHLMQFN